jgi:hypothetical protein
MRRFQLAIAKTSVFLLEVAILSEHPNFSDLVIFRQFYMKQTRQFFIKSAQKKYRVFTIHLHEN